MKNRLLHIPGFHMHHEAIEKKASWLELFYDLIYVAAFIQLGNIFSKNISVEYFLKCLGIFVPLWLTWTGYTYYSNRFNVDDFLHRAIVFLQMFCVGAMAISIQPLFSGDPMMFAIAYSAAQFLNAVLYLRSYIQQKIGRDYSLYWGLTFLLTSILFIASILLGDYYYIGFAISCLVVIGSPLIPKSRYLVEKYPFDFEHLSERYGLLTIIVLGESFVKVLSELSVDGAGFFQILQACFALLLTCSIWWIYFDDVAEAKLKEGRFTMVTWLFSHIPLQLAIIFMGVGIKKAVFFSSAPMNYKYSMLLGLSIGVILISVAIIDSVTLKNSSVLKNNIRSNVRLFTGILMCLIAAISNLLSGTLFLCLCLFICVFQIIFDILSAPDKIDEKELERNQIPFQNLKKDGENKNRFQQEPVRKGVPSSLKNDIYYFLLESTWTKLTVFIMFVYLVSNIFFGLLYMLDQSSISGIEKMTFYDAFFFSVQTMSTIGFGTLSPSGIYSNLIVTIEAAFGILGVAAITGVFFSKLSKPNAKVLFSNNILDTIINGKRALTFRVGNARGNNIVDAKINISLLIDHVTKEGEHIRKLQDLKLERNTTPAFRLTWSITHIIDETSPLYNLDKADILTVICSLTGHDGTFASTIFARHNYIPVDFIKNTYFEDVMSELPDGRLMIDYDKFHLLKANV